MPNETPTKSSGETVVEKGKPLPTDLAEQQDEKAATGEKVPESEKRSRRSLSRRKELMASMRIFQPALLMKMKRLTPTTLLLHNPLGRGGTN